MTPESSRIGFNARLFESWQASGAPADFIDKFRPLLVYPSKGVVVARLRDLGGGAEPKEAINVSQAIDDIIAGKEPSSTQAAVAEPAAAAIAGAERCGSSRPSCGSRRAGRALLAERSGAMSSTLRSSCLVFGTSHCADDWLGLLEAAHVFP
ncbi:MAG: hypothetical protein JNK04_07280 [Myxococcales bacterium]|nr:hypothetical protein [Myxococcales bacterium]